MWRRRSCWALKCGGGHIIETWIASGGESRAPHHHRRCWSTLKSSRCCCNHPAFLCPIVIYSSIKSHYWIREQMYRSCAWFPFKVQLYPLLICWYHIVSWWLEVSKGAMAWAIHLEFCFASLFFNALFHACRFVESRPGSMVIASYIDLTVVLFTTLLCHFSPPWARKAVFVYKILATLLEFLNNLAFINKCFEEFDNQLKTRAIRATNDLVLFELKAH